MAGEKRRTRRTRRKAGERGGERNSGKAKEKKRGRRQEGGEGGGGGGYETSIHLSCLTGRSESDTPVGVVCSLCHASPALCGKVLALRETMRGGGGRGGGDRKLIFSHALPPADGGAEDGGLVAHDRSPHGEEDVAGLRQ